MKRFYFLILLALVLILPTQVSAKGEISFSDVELPAGQVDITQLPIELQEKYKKRTEEINAYFEKLGSLRVEADLAKQNFDESMTFSTEALSHYNNISKELKHYEENSLEIAGLRKLTIEQGTLQPMSTESQVTVNAPVVYYDDDSDLYVLESSWQWNVENPDYNNDGKDGFGIHSAQERLSIFDLYVNVWTPKGTKYSNPNLSPKVEANGYYAEFSDYGAWGNYAGHRGLSWAFFRFYDAKPVGKYVNFNAMLDHTWSGVNITSVTIGLLDIQVQFSAGNNWRQTKYATIKF